MLPEQQPLPTKGALKSKTVQTSVASSALMTALAFAVTYSDQVRHQIESFVPYPWGMLAGAVFVAVVGSLSAIFRNDAVKKNVKVRGLY